MSKKVSKDEALKAVKTLNNENPESSLQSEAMEAVKTLILWAGDNPEREGLLDTPKRVVKAYKQFFSGYNDDPEEILSRTFEEVDGYDDAVIVRDIRLESHCEHHMVPIIGIAHIAYIPVKKVVGISKLARTVEIFAKRLQTQETMTQQIASAINNAMKPKGVAVFIKAIHQCMTTRGVEKPNVSTITNTFLGDFKTKIDLQRQFLNYISNS